jgi:hypothetical protein
MESRLVVEARNADGEVVLTWEFVQTPECRFLWRALALDGAARGQSQATFATLEECAADARRACLCRRDARESHERV